MSQSILTISMLPHYLMTSINFTFNIESFDLKEKEYQKNSTEATMKTFVHILKNFRIIFLSLLIFFIAYLDMARYVKVIQYTVK